MEIFHVRNKNLMSSEFMKKFVKIDFFGSQILKELIFFSKLQKILKYCFTILLNLVKTWLTL